MQQIKTFDSNGCECHAFIVGKDNYRKCDVVRICNHYYDDLGQHTSTVVPKEFDLIRPAYIDCMVVYAIEYDLEKFANVDGII